MIFQLTGQGSVYAKRLYATDNGRIAGWNFDSTGFEDATKSVFLAPSGRNVSINEETKKVVFQAGSNFRVDNTGVLYASGANISGVLTAGAGSNIGGLQVSAGGDHQTLSFLYENSGLLIDLDSSGSAETTVTVGNSNGANVMLTQNGIVLDNQSFTQLGRDRVEDRHLPMTFYVLNAEGKRQLLYLYLTKDRTVKWGWSDNLPIDELSGATAKQWNGEYQDIS